MGVPGEQGEIQSWARRLFIAAEKGFVDVVRVLVQRMGVDLDVPDDAGWTACWASAIRREKGASVRHREDSARRGRGGWGCDGR